VNKNISERRHTTSILSYEFMFIFLHFYKVSPDEGLLTEPKHVARVEYK